MEKDAETDLIRAIIFDFDGTLVDFGDSDIAALKHVYSLVESDGTADCFVDAAMEEIMFFHDMVDRGEIDPLQIHDIRLSRVFKKLGIGWNDRFVGIYKSQLVKEVREYAGVITLLESLAGRVKLGLLTNAYESVLQRKRINASGLAGFFSEIIIAGEVGLSKPDPAIFLLMSRKLDVLPEECLFVGDSVQYDIMGSASVGMKTLLYGANRSFSNIADHEAKSIQEMDTLLNGLLVQQDKRFRGSS